MRHVFGLLSLAVLGIGLYLKLFYDVPDGLEAMNLFVSWFLMILGISTLLINLVWTASKPASRGRD
jgi:hypothetical protein